MFQFWFNTFFVSGMTPKATEGESSMDVKKCNSTADNVHDGELGKTFYFELEKEDLDKANKDKKNKIFSPNFKVRLSLWPLFTSYSSCFNVRYI